MRVKRTASIVIGGGALAAWLAGAATTTRPPIEPIVTRRAAIDAHGADLANEITRLHERLRPASTPRAPARNVFRFHAAPASIAPSSAAPVRAAIVEPPSPRPAAPALKLSGIAEDAGADGPVRVAFINGNGQLYMVKEGEMVTAQYRVAKIGADAVELLDTTDGTTRRVALR